MNSSNKIMTKIAIMMIISGRTSLDSLSHVSGSIIWNIIIYYVYNVVSIK